MTSTQVAVTDVTKVYPTKGGGGHRVLGPLSLQIPQGQFVSVLGPSGCGKSTLLRVVAGLTAHTSGGVTIGGASVRGPQTQVGLAFQAPVLLEWLTVRKNIELQAVNRSMDSRSAQRRTDELLALVGLEPEMAARRPSQLSGGQQQRVAIARALLHSPELVLLDEPFGALDAITRDQIADDLQKLWRSMNVTVMLVTHSIEEAVFLSDRVVVMSGRPGTVKLDLSITLPHRDFDVRDTEEFRGFAHVLREAIDH
ncbi:MAG: ABC transporter ATP-binding protein [Microbacterium sp.]|uniref:ABC transporter ATP-binding protein n=1 Tax=Microbacterium sp. TaxID=51671 RepID=UPI0039E49066